METKITWEAFRQGYVGILPCGLTITLLREEEGGFRVRFGTAELRGVYSSPDAAKAEGMALARRVLTECLIALGD